MKSFSKNFLDKILIESNHKNDYPLKVVFKYKYLIKEMVINKIVVK